MVINSIKDALRARPLDRLAVITLLASFYWVQTWGLMLIHTDQSIFSPSNFIALTLIGISILGIVASHLTPLLLINATAYVVIYLFLSPIASNNRAMTFYFSATVIAASLTYWLQTKPRVIPVDREALFKAIAGPGRWILAVMYFYGIYHKINADFLNPDVSCAVVLYKELAVRVGLENWKLAHYGAIWATFVVEGIAMVLLFSSRFKKVGFIIGIPFHVIIGWTGYGYYMDFSTIVMITYALFLPASAPRAAFDWVARWAGGEKRALLFGRVFMIGGLFVTLLFIGVFENWRGFMPSWTKYRLIFTIYAGVFYALAVAFVPWRTTDNLPALRFKPFWPIVFPVLFFISCASPYLGLKTESSVAMFSNLHTEGGETNHYLTGVLPFGFHYQDDVVRVLTSSNPKILDAMDMRSGVRTLANNVGFVRYQFDRMLADDPALKVTFMYKGQVRTNDATWENTYLKSSWFEKKFLLFKPVDFERPKICTH